MVYIIRFSGRKYGERDKLLCLAYAMRLSLSNQPTLYLAGKSELYSKAKRDTDLIFGFQQKLTVLQVDDLLYEAQEKILLGEPFSQLHNLLTIHRKEEG